MATIEQVKEALSSYQNIREGFIESLKELLNLFTKGSYLNSTKYSKLLSSNYLFNQSTSYLSTPLSSNSISSFYSYIEEDLPLIIEKINKINEKKEKIIDKINFLYNQIRLSSSTSNINLNNIDLNFLAKLLEDIEQQNNLENLILNSSLSFASSLLLGLNNEKRDEGFESFETNDALTTLMACLAYPPYLSLTDLQLILQS